MISSSTPGIRRVLILGHSGFIGSRLERSFKLQSPNLEIVGRSMPETDLTKMEDVESLSDLCDGGTAVIVCSAIKRQLGDTLHTFSDNLRMIVNLCSLLQTRPVGRVVYFSSAAVYGEDAENLNVTERTPIHPSSYYGAAKFASECLLRKTLDVSRGGSLLILRPALVYGAGEKGAFYSPSGFAKLAADGQPITLWGDGSELREFLYVDDVAAVARELTLRGVGGVFNVACGRSRSFKEIVDILSRLLARPVEVVSRPRSRPKVDLTFSNAAVARALPGFAFTSLEEGIKKVIS